MHYFYTFLITLLCCFPTLAQTWKVGTAKSDITPQKYIWQAGYASRDKPATGIMHPLWAKAMAFQDATGKKGLFISTDILGFPKPVSDAIRDKLAKSLQLEKSQIILSSSHTHSGPVIANALVDIYAMNEAQLKDVSDYTAQLEKVILEISKTAFANLQPAQIQSGTGIARFGINRRNNDQEKVPDLFELKGPSDTSVPVLKITSATGTVLGIIFGYACHPTVLSGYDYSGDYPGFAQMELERLYPTAQAMFFLGAAGDQNPLPRRSLGLAKQYGKELAAAVERVIEEPMNTLHPTLKTAYSEINLGLLSAPKAEHLKKMVDGNTGYIQSWAKRMLALTNKGVQHPSNYPYPVQIWMLGNQPLFSLGGEVTIEYAIKLKQMFGKNIFVAAYTNDVMAYIPSLTIWREGGYEGETSQMVYGLPAKWEASIESNILQEAYRLGKQIGLVTP